MFRIRVFNYFYLSLYHLTDETSLIFAATFLCRITASLSYNFLGMIHMDQAITHLTDRPETAFTSVSDRMSSGRSETLFFCIDHGRDECYSDYFQRF